jgi:hypothetical protein
MTTDDFRFGTGGHRDGAEECPLSGLKRKSGQDTFNVRFWHKADIATVPNDVRFWG